MIIRHQKSNIMSRSSIALIIIGSLILISVGLFGCPMYRVWQQEKEGEAELKRAEQNRQIRVQEALASKESASLLAQADTIRAHGIARTQQIIGSSLSEEYLKWYWIDNLEKTPGATIYIPTEANIPIMEATRLKKSSNENDAK